MYVLSSQSNPATPMESKNLHMSEGGLLLLNTCFSFRSLHDLMLLLRGIFGSCITVSSVCLIIFHRVVLVENIPDDISFLENGTPHVPLSAGLNSLLDRAVRVVEIVSPVWLLNASDYESSFQPAARQVNKTHTQHESALVWFCYQITQVQKKDEPRSEHLLGGETHTRYITIIIITTNIAFVIMHQAPLLRWNVIKLLRGGERNISFAK